jgi:preprotein translocase subunit SecA
MMAKVSATVLSKFFSVQIQRQEEVAALEAEAEAKHHAEFDHTIAQHPGEEGEVSPTELLAQIHGTTGGSVAPPARRQAPAVRIGRNDLCPCGSGKKFKKCHGASDDEESSDESDE